jgi:hypothetical protein
VFEKFSTMKKFFHLFFVICIYAGVSAQETSPLPEQLGLYAVNTLQEKVFLHLDKSSYIAGEILWFKAYNVDASLNKLFNLNKVAYLEVINNKNIPVLQTKIELKEGLGNGSVNLPASMPSGLYTVRSYTNWMKNFPADYFFEKPIVVINALKIPDSSLNSPSNREATLRFFPEGGQLVAGIKSKVAFRMAGMDDRGLDCSGFILSESNDTIVSFQSLKFGIGSFEFTPSPGSAYKAIARSNDGSNVITQDLPAVQEKGYVLNIKHPGPEQILVNVQARGTVEQQGSLSMLVHARQMPKMFSTTEMKNGTAGFNINTSQLPDGISHITIFRNGIPVCERLYCKKPSNQMRVVITTDAKEYGERNRVALNVIVESENKPQVINSSVSVFRADSLQDAGIDDFQTYLLLTGDLRGRIDSANYYFSSAGDAVIEALDNLMLTHGWSRFKWEEVSSNQGTALRYVHEQAGHIISGKITDAGSGVPQNDMLVYLSTPSRNVRLTGSVSNSKGEFRFVTREFYGHNEIIVQAPSKNAASYRIDVNTPFSEKQVTGKLPFFHLSPSIEQSLQSASIGMQVQHLFYEKENRKFLLPGMDTAAFYGTPDNTYLLDDYTRFTTIEEILREYVPQVNVRKQNGKFRLQMYDTENKTLNFDPLILLDGVPMFDVDRFMTMDPLKLSKLDVIPNPYFLGAIRADGIASFISYNGDMAEFEPDPGALVIDYEGLQLHREFYSPDYSTPELLNSRLPDFRNVLFWQPDLNTDEKGKGFATFYTSNQPGKYRVVIHGITKDGKAVTGVSSFIVKPGR